MKQFVLLILTLTSLTSFSQTENKTVPKRHNDIIKWNVTGLVFNNLNVQYERTVAQKLSLIAGAGYIIEGNIPFSNNIKENDIDFPSEFLDAQLKGYFINLEARFYLGKGYGQGLYLSPYYRYSTFTATDINVKIEEEDNIDKTVLMEGTSYAHSGGLLIGSQWNLDDSKKWVLDLWMLGVHLGEGKIDIETSNNDLSLTEEEQNDLREQINDLEIPESEITIKELNSNSAKAHIKGPWAGIRFGISIGYRF